ncbi:alpha/beta fold hydrolase [Streptomyces sp. NPDC091267]|uniref:alpha/beta fold hydrolase n=2 Tax=unclassified Streptomyces TaxID=2593676 RepID=UPI003435239D
MKEPSSLAQSPLANDPSRTRREAALSADIQRFARGRLASPMVPSRIVVVDELPRLPNGKTDRSQLRAPETPENPPDIPAGLPAPADSTEAAACALWADILGLECVDPAADFFELGGTSLTAVRMVAQWAARGGSPLDLAHFLEHPTPQHMARLTDGHRVPGFSWLTDPQQLTTLAVLPADIRPSGPPPQAGRADPHGSVLVTRADTYLDLLLLRELLDRSDAVVNVLFLSGEVADTTQRLHDRMRSSELWRPQDTGRLRAVPGDLSQPYLGVPPASYRALAREVDLIVHTGECSDTRASFEQLTPVNVLGTQEVLRFAAAEKLKPVHFLSQLSVAHPALETAPSQDQLLPANAVSGALRQSKWIGEHYMHQAAARGIPTRVHRLGQVAAPRGQHVELGDAFLSALIRTCVSLRAAPDLDLSFPVTSMSTLSGILARQLSRQEFLSRAPGRDAEAGDRPSTTYTADASDVGEIVDGRPVSWGEIVSNVRFTGRALDVVPYDHWRQLLLATVERSEIHPLTPFLALVTADGLCSSLGYRSWPAFPGQEQERAAPAPPLDHVAGRDLLRTYPSRADNLLVTTAAGLVVREHTVTVPLDHARPDGPTIEVYAQEVVSAHREGDDLPWILFLQGGPGAPCPTPTSAIGWLATALEGHRVLLLDQRGGGRSAPITAKSTEGRSPEELASYLRHFRADSIVADAEAFREQLAGSRRWSILGQSYGGFIALTYLSTAPEGLDAVFVSGGLPGLSASVDEVYDQAYTELLTKNAAYYTEYPEDEAKIRRLAAYLDDHDVRLPDGDRLTSRRLRLLGRNLGMSNGSERVHRLFEQAWDGDRISDVFRRAVVTETGLADMQLYALQEFVYARAGSKTGWAAHRALARFPAFAADGDGPLLLFGEMMFPWMFEEISPLKPFKDVAHLLAGMTDYPDPYDLDVLAANEIPVVALVYAGDLYTPVELQLATAAVVGNTRLLMTEEFHHNGLMRNSGLFDRLLEMARADTAN